LADGAARYPPIVAQTAAYACLREVGRRLKLTYWFPNEQSPAPVMV
jgi:hypothetical protein